MKISDKQLSVLECKQDSGMAAFRCGAWYSAGNDRSHAEQRFHAGLYQWLMYVESKLCKIIEISIAQYFNYMN